MSVPEPPPSFGPSLAAGESGHGPANGRAEDKGSPSPSGPADRTSQPAGAPERATPRPTHEDVVAYLKKQQREQEAFRVGLLKIRERALPMKLTRVEQLPDLSRLIFYFTAEGRVDFRELVRELVAEFRTRIEMRQIGVRDEAKMLGGYGSCGRPLCCTTWLQSFEPISIRMAKQQELSLNPSKLSGLCGRLKCCLRYELANGRPSKEAAGRQAVECPGCDKGPEPDTPRR